MKWTILLTLVWACSRGAAAETKNPPAKIAHAVKEVELATITLTPEAERRLGVVVAAVERRKMEATRLFGGEIILPAPAATNGQSIFTVMPALSPAELIRIAEAQIDAESQIDRAKVTLDATRVTLQRAEKLVAEKAGSVRAVDDAKAQVALAEAGVRAATARRELLGAPVLDFTTVKKFWVRVPVYVGDLRRLDTAAEGRVGELSGAASTNTVAVKPVPAPPSANAVASTVDLFYEWPNENGAFRFGQKVGVTIPLREREDSLVVPWSAVVSDFHGGAWVYENPAPHTFVRRRVHVRRVAGHDAVLDRGPEPGAKVVTIGVAELFGTEFGAGK